MNDESVPLGLPLLRVAESSSEVTTLYRELRKPLLRYVLCLGLTNDEAQDVVQEAFLSLQRHLAADGDQQNIKGWLFRVAHNQARNRQASYHQKYGETLDEKTDFPADNATPEQAMLEKEKWGRFAAAIQTLTESERECLLLRAGGLRYREIGEVLGIATSTVGERVERAVRKLTEKCNV